MSRLILRPFSKEEPEEEIVFSMGKGLFKTKSGKIILINPISKVVSF